MSKLSPILSNVENTVTLSTCKVVVYPANVAAVALYISAPKAASPAKL